MKKQETIKEAAKMAFSYEDGEEIYMTDRKIDAFIQGAEWQAETYKQFTLAMDDLKSSRDGYLKAKKEYESKQSERMYSEEDMHKLMDEYQDYLFKTDEAVKTFKEWFEQFKKK